MAKHSTGVVQPRLAISARLSPMSAAARTQSRMRPRRTGPVCPRMSSDDDAGAGQIDGDGAGKTKAVTALEFHLEKRGNR